MEKLLDPSSLRQCCGWWSFLWYFCPADKTGRDITVWKNTPRAPCKQVVSLMNTTVGDSAPEHPNLKRKPHLAVLCRQLGGLETSPWASGRWATVAELPAVSHPGSLPTHLWELSLGHGTEQHRGLSVTQWGRLCRALQGHRHPRGKLCMNQKSFFFFFKTLSVMNQF